MSSTTLRSTTNKTFNFISCLITSTFFYFAPNLIFLIFPDYIWTLCACYKVYIGLNVKSLVLLCSWLYLFESGRIFSNNVLPLTFLLWSSRNCNGHIRGNNIVFQYQSRLSSDKIYCGFHIWVGFMKIFIDKIPFSFLKKMILPTVFIQGIFFFIN